MKNGIGTTVGIVLGLIWLLGVGAFMVGGEEGKAALAITLPPYGFVHGAAMVLEWLPWRLALGLASVCVLVPMSVGLAQGLAAKRRWEREALTLAKVHTPPERDAPPGRLDWQTLR